MADNYCMSKIALSSSIVKFLKSNAAFSSFKIFLPLVISCKDAQSVPVHFELYWGNITSIFLCIEVFNMPTIVDHKVGFV